jgi:cell wall assembly regulator SMI1
MLDGHGVQVFGWSTLAIVIVLSGFAGVMLGAWLMTRTEQWNLKREHYGRVLRSLADIKAFIGRLQKKEAKIGKGHINLLERSFADHERTAAGSAVMLSEEAVEVLEELEAQWKKVKTTSDGEVLVAEGYRVVNDSYKRLLAASRSDLGLQKSARK